MFAPKQCTWPGILTLAVDMDMAKEPLELRVDQRRRMKNGRNIEEWRVQEEVYIFHASRSGDEWYAKH